MEETTTVTTNATSTGYTIVDGGGSTDAIDFERLFVPVTESDEDEDENEDEVEVEVEEDIVVKVKPNVDPKKKIEYQRTSDDDKLQTKRRAEKKITIDSFKRDWRYIAMTTKYDNPVFIDLSTKAEMVLTFNENFERVVSNSYQQNNATKYTCYDHRYTFYLPNKEPLRIGSIENFVIVDFEKLMDSKGKIFQIKYKQGIANKKLANVHRSIKRMFEDAEKHLNTLREIHNSIFLENNLDYMINLNFGDEKAIRIRSCIKVDDITIRNSIELEKYIGTIFVYFDFIFYRDLMHIHSEVRGLRLTHTPIDLLCGYSHSHLPTSSGSSFDRFCLGSIDHMLSGVMRNNHNYGFFGSYYYRISELELEAALLGLIPYLSWESLEGGPHIRIENTQIVRNGTKLLQDAYRIHENIELTTYDYYGKYYEVALMFELEREKIMKAFSLKKVRNGFEYVYNEKKLFKILSEVSSNHILNVEKFSYSSEDHSFTILSRNATGNIDEIKNRIKNKLEYKFPIFFKNENIRPFIINESETDEILSSIKSVPHPFYIKATADAIVRILNKTLNNEYRQR